ncbi:MAG: hypothetical protein QOF39_3232, partial [Frankiales bacterium]|nr:hypothetical protein [Frankiales bacterium]
MDTDSTTVVPKDPIRRLWRWRNLLRRCGVVLLVTLALLSPWEWSLFRAMTAPGGDSEQARVAEWVRSQGGGGLVTWAENLQYRLHPAKVGGAPPSDSPLLQPTAAP